METGAVDVSLAIAVIKPGPSRNGARWQGLRRHDMEGVRTTASIQVEEKPQGGVATRDCEEKRQGEHLRMGGFPFL
jgi:hypothetical protein